MLCMAGVSMRAEGSVMHERVEISAPIVPRTGVIYQSFPTTLEGEKAMAHAAALNFEWLLKDCAPQYPKIVLEDDDAGVELTPDQLAVNYAEVARCAYDKYVAKPYWIPKLVDDVDICGTEMGDGYRLITEADLASLDEADFQSIASTWNLALRGGPGELFDSPDIWVRAADGTIAAGTLAPDAQGKRVTPLAPGTSPTLHYEGSLGLRCIRRTDAS
jgi:hypothetical protein